MMVFFIVLQVFFKKKPLLTYDKPARRRGVEAQISALAHVEVLSVHDGSRRTPQGEVHASEDVLREVQHLRSLGDAALLHHELLVHHVRVAIVHACAQEAVGALEHRAEGRLRARGKVAQGADVALKSN